ncbi:MULTISPECIES: hypothetical protein [unclassified Nodularia (in: cyanobacteria)]|nr:hypothetical protein [Nodularia sp. LEGE 04288]MCC2693929.1 hypothetical protein [Nodularia sp. LEGE 04288]
MNLNNGGTSKLLLRSFQQNFCVVSMENSDWAAIAHLEIKEILEVLKFS